MNVLKLPINRLVFCTSTHFDNSPVEQQRGSSKKKGDSSARQCQKQAARKKTTTKAHVESSEGEDELEDTSSSENDRSSLQGKMRTMHASKNFKHRLNDNLIIQQNYI